MSFSLICLLILFIVDNKRGSCRNFRFVIMLSENLILSKTKSERLTAVKNLNLWGAELSDISIVTQLINLEVLALSVNHVATLRDIAECKLLRELYLRKNDIASLGEVYYLSKLPNLTTLWLSDNPCAKEANYRLFTIRCCSNLKQLDSIEVSAQERSDAQQLPATLINDIINTRNQPPPPMSATPVAPAAQVQPKGPLPSVPDVAPRQSPSPMPVSSANGGRQTPSASSSRQTQKAILTAIITLMQELTPDMLEVLQQNVGERLKKK